MLPMQNKPTPCQLIWKINKQNVGFLMICQSNLTLYRYIVM
ncbi:hypothetical protein SAMN05660862_0535 [Sphingobacterium psychroaquaticum]|uniref:Uncharacterized protein n=1 Tax=Sphingobacterium psychroaquaticum TaxID=561061 RepID=A0A1X7I7Y6_9SPHI|nr:hypothetical protein SAMN05660862_0535 [Sphingobacterium psychroaquaticum]